MIFSEKLYFSYGFGPMAEHGYISKDGIETKGIKPSFNGGYIEQGNLFLPSQKIKFGINPMDEKGLKFIYDYSQIANETFIPVYVYNKGLSLLGEILPPSYRNFETQYIYTNNDSAINDNGAYVGIYRGCDFTSFPRVYTEEPLYTNTNNVTGVLYIGKDAVLTAYGLDVGDLSEVGKCLAKLLVEAYISYYARSLLKNNEIMVLENRDGRKLNLSGLSVDGEMRFISECSGIVDSPKFIQQPFIFLNKERKTASGYVPEEPNNIETMREIELDFDNLEDAPFIIAESMVNTKYSPEILPYTETLGCNKKILFLDRSFSHKLLTQW